MARPMKLFTLLLALTLASGSAFAQRSDREPRGAGGKNQGMSKDQRERMRQDMRNVYQDKGGQARPQQRQMSPQEREKLRRDIQDANRDLRR